MHNKTKSEGNAAIAASTVRGDKKKDRGLPAAHFARLSVADASRMVADLLDNSNDHDFSFAHDAASQNNRVLE